MSDAKAEGTFARKPAEILPLTGLRFVAAFYVFLFHVQLRFPLPVPAFLGRVIENGAAGMSLFFVLSGYVLAYRYAGRKIDLKDYFWSRVGRIYPIYLLCALLSLPLLYLQVIDGRSPLLKAGAVVVADGLMVQAWFPRFFFYLNNAGSWSISAEAFFYSAFPALILLFSRPRRLWAIMGVAYLAAVVPGLYYLSSDMAFRDGVTTFYPVPIFRVGEFVLGIAAYHLRRVWDGQGATLLMCGALASVIAYLGLAPRGIYVTNNWLVVPGVTALVLAASAGTGLPNRLLGSPVMVRLGKGSYSFYSFQTVLMISLDLYGAKVGTLPIHNPVLIMIGTLVALVIVADLAYRFIEEPARIAICRRFQSKAPTQGVPTAGTPVW